MIAFMGDNISSNDVIAQELERKCMAIGAPFRAQEGRLRCVPHTIHLAASEVCSSQLCNRLIVDVWNCRFSTL
jgi:hypothetical protein